jgi:hypothetical protein
MGRTIDKQGIFVASLSGSLGGLSIGLMQALFTFTAVDLNHLALSLTPGYLVGTMIRVTLFAFLGAMWAFQASTMFAFKAYRTQPPHISFQLGMIPALFVIMVTSTAFVTTKPLVKTSLAEVSTPLSFASLGSRGENILLAQAQETKQAKESNVLSGLTGTPPAAGGGSGYGFWIIFGVVSIFTFFSGVANIYLVVGSVDATKAATLVDNFNTTWKLGFGAIIGLIGGKSF